MMWNEEFLSYIHRSISLLFWSRLSNLKWVKRKWNCHHLLFCTFYRNTQSADSLCQECFGNPWFHCIQIQKSAMISIMKNTTQNKRLKSENKNTKPVALQITSIGSLHWAYMHCNALSPHWQGSCCLVSGHRGTLALWECSFIWARSN